MATLTPEDRTLIIDALQDKKLKFWDMQQKSQNADLIIACDGIITRLNVLIEKVRKEE